MPDTENQLLFPNEKICGVSKDVLTHWNWVNNNLDIKVSPEESRLVQAKYFGKDAEIKVEVLAADMVHELCIRRNSDCSGCPLKFNCISFGEFHDPEATTFADFFCGAGGISVGFENAGLVPTLANDIDPWFVTTYMFNRPKQNIEYSIGNITEWLESNQQRQNWNIDIVSGGVPCQSFSNANRQRVGADHRDDLYQHLLEAAVIINPSIILIENVSGILIKYEDIIEDLREIGFQARHIILNAKDFGIPQNRKRVFFIALNQQFFENIGHFHNMIFESINEMSNQPFVTLFEAISDLPVVHASYLNNKTDYNNDTFGRSLVCHNLINASDYAKGLNSYRVRSALFNHKARYNNERDIEIFQLLEPGENSLSEKIIGLNPYADRNHIFKDKYFKLDYQKYCRTITAHMRYDCNMYIHPTQARGLTAREAARVQSFPDHYAFLGNFQRIYQQIGNAVPPKLAEVIGNALNLVL